MPGTLRAKREKAERDEVAAQDQPLILEKPPDVHPGTFLVAAGFHHTFVRYKGTCCDGEHVFGFGHNGDGQLGHPPEVGSTMLEPKPLPMMDRKHVVLIAAGYNHSLFLDDHRLYGCGSNAYGQLGLPPCDPIPEPVLIPAFTGEFVLDVAAGRAHTIVCCALQFLRSDDPRTNTPAKVLTFGYGTEGCLGHGDKDHRHIPTEVPFFRGRNVRKVAASRTHSVVLDDTAVYVFGIGSFGGLRTPLFTPYPLYEPAVVPGLGGTIPIMIAAGGHHTVVWCQDGVYTFGCSADGALGFSMPEDRPCTEARRVAVFDGRTIRGIAAGRQHTLVWCEDGVYSFGSGVYGQLGLGKRCKQTTDPIAIPFFRTKVPPGHRIVSLHCGCFSSFVLTTFGLFAFGDCRYGKLGIGALDDIWEPQAVDGFMPFFKPVVVSTPATIVTPQSKVVTSEAIPTVTPKVRHNVSPA